MQAGVDRAASAQRRPPAIPLLCGHLIWDHLFARVSAPMASETHKRVLPSRFDQTFPVLSPVEIERVRQFGELRRFPSGHLLCRVGEPSPGMYVILSGRVRVVSRDAFGRSLSPAEFAQIT